jgi:hypothetical protein
LGFFFGQNEAIFTNIGNLIFPEKTKKKKTIPPPPRIFAPPVP